LVGGGCNSVAAGLRGIAGDHFHVSRYPENQLYRANDRRERYLETFFD